MSVLIEELTPEEQAHFEAMRAEDQPPASPAPGADAPDTPAAREVPIEALHSERRQRQELERQIGELDRNGTAQAARLQERLDLLTAAVRAPAPAAKETPAPDPDADPVGYMRYGVDHLAHQLDGLSDRLGKVEGFTQANTRQAEQRRQTHDMIQWGHGQEAVFTAQHPDYAQAAQFLRDSRSRELQATGIADADRLTAQLAHDTLGLAAMARQRGQNFGELIYSLAKARGYRAAAAAPASRTAPSVEALANMNDAQFADYLGKVSKNPTALRQVFGE